MRLPFLALLVASLYAQDIVSPSRVLNTTFDATLATWTKPMQTVTPGE